MSYLAPSQQGFSRARTKDLRTKRLMQRRYSKYAHPHRIPKWRLRSTPINRSYRPSTCSAKALAGELNAGSEADYRSRASADRPMWVKTWT